MSSARYHHQATALADGRALILGGHAANQYELSSTELFDPATLRFQAGAPMFYRRGSQSLSVLSDGSLYLAGGVNGYLSAAYATAELYDPGLGRSLPSAVLQKKRGGHSVTELADDGVLLSGGFFELTAGSAQVSDGIELVYPRGCPR